VAGISAGSAGGVDRAGFFLVGAFPGAFPGAFFAGAFLVGFALGEGDGGAMPDLGS
jgi:hypothetical protein